MHVDSRYRHARSDMRAHGDNFTEKDAHFLELHIVAFTITCAQATRGKLSLT